MASQQFKECADCGVEHDVADMQPKGEKQLICKPCNSVESRIKRLECSCKFQLKSLDTEEKKTFMEKART
eukprot:12417721-Karenia_brevis.AAC.1